MNILSKSSSAKKSSSFKVSNDKFNSTNQYSIPKNVGQLLPPTALKCDRVIVCI